VVMHLLYLLTVTTYLVTHSGSGNGIDLTDDKLTPNLIDLTSIALPSKIKQRGRPKGATLTFIYRIAQEETMMC